MEVKSGNYIRKLVVTGAMGALAVFLGITRLGFFPWISGASITILHIPAIIGAILEGPFVGAGIRLIFGIFSLIQANMNVTLFDIAFRNPLVSVLPRVAFPIVAWGIYWLIARWKKLPAVIVASVLGAVAHTSLVLAALVATNGSGILTGGAAGVSVWAVVGTIFVANGIPEAVASGILCTLVVAAWSGISSSKGKSRLSGEK
ncbi:MAG TPA: ECF transporter S component [Treponemataceae bacterium]|nr:ECF transporter S component [Treponemataceae bacterium]